MTAADELLNVLPAGLKVSGTLRSLEVLFVLRSLYSHLDQIGHRLALQGVRVRHWNEIIAHPFGGSTKLPYSADKCGQAVFHSCLQASRQRIPVGDAFTIFHRRNLLTLCGGDDFGYGLQKSVRLIFWTGD